MAFVGSLGLRSGSEAARTGFTNGWSSNGPTRWATNGDVLVVRLRMKNLPVVKGTTNPDMGLVTPPNGWRLISYAVARQGMDPRVAAITDGLWAKLGTYEDGATDYFYWTIDTSKGATFEPDGGKWSGLWRGTEKAISHVGWTMEQTAAIDHTILPPAVAGISYAVQVSNFGFYELGWHYGHLYNTRTVPTNDVHATVSDFVHGTAPANVSGYFASYRAGSHNRVLAAQMAQMLYITFSTAPTPLAPVIVSPAIQQTFDAPENGLAIAWRHLQGFASEQTGWTLRASIGSAVTYWNATTRTWEPSAVRNLGGAQDTFLPPAAFAGTHGKAVYLGLQTYSDNVASPWSQNLVVWSVPSPTTVATVAGRDAAGEVASLRPSLNFMATAGASNLVITGWEATLANLATDVVYATGASAVDASGLGASWGSTLATTAALSWSPNFELLNGEDFVFSVRTQQQGGEWSTWVSETGRTNVTVPGAPSIELTNVKHAESGVPGVSLYAVFPFETDGFRWETGTDTTVDIERLDAGAWVRVAEIAAAPHQAHFVYEDYGAAGGPVTYRMAARSLATDGSRLQGHWQEATIETTVEGGWLLDATNPAAALHLFILEEDGQERETNQTSFNVLGRSDPLVNYGTPTLRRGSHTVLVNGQDEEDALYKLLTSGSQLKLSGYRERDGVRGGHRVGRTLFLRATGNVNVEQAIGRGVYSQRRLSFAWVEQKAPVKKVV